MVWWRVPATTRQQEQEAPRSGALTEKGFRLDIQGIRGFALILVLLCHASVPWAEGGFVGLDIFFVLSGFLITGLILAEIDKTGTVSIVRFYARRARRLLPLAVTVLIVILVGALVLFSSIRTEEVSGDVIAAALYFVNWRFMAQAVDYFAFEDPNVSPVQHYWSLSVEEQFYLVWPLLVLAVLVVARRRGLGHRGLLAVLIGTLTIGSFAYGVWFSEVSTQQAYFSTLSRGWEIGVGCALALVLPAGLRMPRLLATVLSGGAIAALAWMTLTFRDDIPYPGWYALVPTMATAAWIVAGTAVTAAAPIRLFSLAPMQYLGKISYAWYLWHWPALVFAAKIFGPLSVTDSVLVTLAAWVPTIVSHHLIEERFRRSSTLARRPGLSLRVGATFTVTAVALAVTFSAVQPSVPVASGEQAVGARVLERGEAPQQEAVAIRPDLAKAEDDRGLPFEEGCHIKNDDRVESPECAYGDLRSDTTVVVFGDSHGLQYAPGMIALAERRGWRLESLTRAGCTVALVQLKPRCDQWRENTLRRIARTRPALVVVTTGTMDRYEVRAEDGTRLSREESQPLLERGMEETLRRLKATGAKVAVIRDQPRLPFDPIDCVAGNLESLDQCAFSPDRPVDYAFDARAARRVPGVKLIDPMPLLCPQRICPSVVGNVLVYRNTYHLTATFAATLDRWLGRKLPRLRG